MSLALSALFLATVASISLTRFYTLPSAGVLGAATVFGFPPQKAIFSSVLPSGIESMPSRTGLARTALFWFSARFALIFSIADWGDPPSG